MNHLNSFLPTLFAVIYDKFNKFNNRKNETNRWHCVSALATVNWAFNQGGPVLSFLTDHHWSDNVQYLQVQWPSLYLQVISLQCRTIKTGLLTPFFKMDIIYCLQKWVAWRKIHQSKLGPLTFTGGKVQYLRLVYVKIWEMVLSEKWF